MRATDIPKHHCTQCLFYHPLVEKRLVPFRLRKRCKDGEIFYDTRVDYCVLNPEWYVIKGDPATHFCGHYVFDPLKE